MAIQVGDKAPNFSLKDTSNQTHNLADYKGKNVVLLFFPAVGTGVCEKELCSTRDSMKDYEGLNAQVFGISVDGPFAQKLWVDKYQFNFPLLSDFNKEVAPAYGAFYDVWLPGKWDLKGVAKRSAFVIDKQGVVQYAEVLEVAGDEPNYAAIQECLKKLN
ncbi:MAG: peroxiredoxin [Stygiobacter sp. RIFOXYC12_FULL_38_8]|nr:MAG: peroxiredoxin [Stygiobacter sp. RIFOXYA12_FULL_38_9]OGV07545.1 MAG: peroxiredoxin [Stygiobacter sp. RIFOXYB2_FULL_37_11]OGV10653.1 MAG: peroxiredoxin [Stygiobacter sp. RIFOXYA2_FULL_38_8]OGV13806.1 MAG: peroxiredoxin [Stygiobacter sp. RIFOXYC2_FULL_38_25]OGV24296.1 MAG: peroxiredoxin [Stygiobacter sp. RIFOXYC12_FULL_38_8]OGV80190.1 MAG: peroxiredoxin [Stygiobacter sp. GWF2_38_21]RJQ59396.1 MAG: peroxiredoxin [Stygiobacter sp.]